MVDVGFTLQPDDEFLELTHSIAAAADYLEIAPETTWYETPSGALLPNGFHRRFAALRARGVPFVAHGVGLSPGSDDAADGARLERWLARIRDDHATFGFGWYTDHLGASSLAGLAMTLPLATPLDDASAGRTRARLARLQSIVPDVGLENTVFYFSLGDPLDEPRFIERVLDAPGMHLLLDLHNVYTSAMNFGFDAREWLARAPLDRVIEIHVSGGSESDPAWLPSGRTLRLDGHDAAVPEAVWSLLEEIAPRCAQLRGITLERMEGTVTDAREACALRDELDRVRGVARRLG